CSNPMTAADQPTLAGRMPSLDGVRAIAVALVVISHITGNELASLPILWRFDLGNLGVRIFFVLSGYLITSLLVAELAATNTISLPKFYLRRSLRIFPAFYVMLIVLVVLWRLGLMKLDWASVAISGLYLSDFFRVAVPLGHTWSLAVEEQFY